MKRLIPISILALCAAVIVLFVMQCQNSKKCAANESESNVMVEPNASGLKIAYINTDSLLMNYQLSKDLNEELLKKQEDARTNLNEEARVFEREMVDFRRKLENNGFLSRERAEREQQRLVNKEQELQELNGKLSNELMIRQQEISNQLLDSISNYLETENVKWNYDMILSTTVGGNVLYAKQALNITDKVLQQLNKRYQK